MPPDLLSSRLDALVAAGILSVEIDTEGVEHFVPTNKGQGLETAIRALDQWSRDWDPLSSGELLEIVDVVAIQDAEFVEPVGAAPGPHEPQIMMTMLGTFSLSLDGEPVELSPGSQRLLVLLALRDRAIARTVLAGTMWPDVSEGRAGDSLRSAIARLEAPARAAIRFSASTGLCFANTVTLDLREAQSLAYRLLGTGEVGMSDVSQASIALLSQDLLPDWYDDWVMAEAADWRHLRMTALESLARQLLDAGMLGEATEAARAAMRIDPLRESPQATLIRVQIAMGNEAAAFEVFERYRVILQAALGMAPTKQLADMVAGIER
jgi:DNA-binding SARP family transcriptional activator